MQTIVLRGLPQIDRACQLIRNATEPLMEVVLRPHKSKRSLQQNALHWKRLDIIRMHIADSTGQIFSAEDLHEFFKEKFLPVRLAEIAGESAVIRRTSANLSTKEMAEFMDAIDRYCIDRLNLYLPQPGLEDGE